MSWSRFFNKVEIEGSLDPYKWYGGRGVDAVVGAGRMEIDGDFLSGEEISNFRYRLLVVVTAYEVAKARGQNYPQDIDIATAKKIVDQTLEKRGVSVVGAGRMEIDGDSLSGEEINDLQYRVLVMMAARQIARERGESSPGTSDIAMAQKIVDQTLEKRGISRTHSF